MVNKIDVYQTIYDYLDLYGTFNEDAKVCITLTINGNVLLGLLTQEQCTRLLSKLNE